jgi:hypothetical protein
VIVWSHFICRPRLCSLLFPGGAPVAPRFVLASAGSALPGYIPVELRWTVPTLVLLRTVATCDCCLALGSYVAVVLALEALLHSALSLIPLALEDLTLPDQALVNDLVGILWLAELNDGAGSGFCGCVAGQPSYVLDLCLRDERLVIQQYLVPRLFEPGHVHCAGAYAVCDDAVGCDA